MPRKTVRAEIPTANPEKYTHMIEKVWKKHTAMGASSPFHNNSMVDMTRFEELMTQAFQKREEAQQLYDRARVLMQESRVLFGNDKGQTINTPDTLYYMLNTIKKFLLIKHNGTEEELTPWGFNIVIRTANVGAKKKKKP